MMVNSKITQVSFFLYTCMCYVVLAEIYLIHTNLYAHIIGVNTVATQGLVVYISIYHIECEILMRSTEESLQCSRCKKYKKTLSAMLSCRLKDQKTHPSSHTTYANLSTFEKSKRLRNLHQENKKAKLYVTRLKQKISAAASQDGVMLDDELHNEMKIMMDATTKQVYSLYPEGSF